jgi:surface protein
MFAGCKKLMSLDVSNFNTENVTNMRSMFEDCEILKNLNINNFCITNVVRINNMFEDCCALTELDLSSFDTSNVIKMDEMFNNCTALTTIYVSDKWTMEKVEDGNSMFDGCISLVGGKGTTYDENHTDHTYAHIDGGAGNPGYLTYKNEVSPKKEGDVTGDGTVDATDIVELVNYIIGNPSDGFNEKAADVNGDGVVSVADIVKILNIIMGAE